jgi:Flp pilus assembly protein TadB
MIYRLSQFFPSIGIRSASDKELKMLGAEPKKYMCMALALSALFGFLVSVIFGILIFPIAFGLLAGLFILMPRMRAKQLEAGIEAELPVFLRGLGMVIELGIPFRKALATAAEGNAIQKEMDDIARQAEQGMSLQGALSMLGSRYRSLDIKRAASQLSLCYESGSRGAEIRKIGDDMLAIQRHRLKEFSAKSAMIGLLFIMSSVVMPTFFLVYASAGSFAFGSAVTEAELATAMLIVFPLASVFVLILSKGMMPRSALSGEEKFDFTILAPAAVTVGGSVLLPEWQIIFLIAGAIAGAFIIAKTYREEKRRESIEAALPDAILSIGALPRSAKPEDIFRTIKKGSHGALSKEAGICERQMGMNVRTAAVLDDLWKRNGSAMLRRATAMLRQMIETSSLEKMGLLADDMIAAAEIQRERARLFSMQKYTLILGAFLMPLIMRMMLGLLEGMEGIAQGPGMEFSTSTITSYIIIYAAISSSAISAFEGKKSSAAIYLIILTAMGLFVFHFIIL